MRFLVCILTMCALIYLGCRQEKPHTTVSKIHTYVDHGIDSLNEWIENDFLILINNSSDTDKIRESFFRGRQLYKRIEFAIEYFFNNAARNINGPPLPEIEPEEHIVLDPGGFQVIEEYLFPFDANQRNELIMEAGKLKSMFVRIKTLWEGTQFREDQVFDALRFEFFRLITLGITGFDTPLSLYAIHEVQSSLHSVETILSYYQTSRDNKSLERIQQGIIQAVQYANSNKDFESFDRMDFIRNFINPLTTALLAFQKELHIPVITNVYGLRGDLETIFDSAAFNINYFTPDANSYTTTANISLGKKLFNDPILSGNNKISCASCHHPDKAFTDGFTKSRALGSTGFLVRNTPTLINAGLQKAQFYDMRASYLEDQVRNVIENKDEIHGSLKQAVTRLNNDTRYSHLFKTAFPSITEINERLVQIALSCYIRSLTSLNARFDKYMHGDTSQMNPQEIKGFNLFMGKAKCATCHFMPLFNGTVPPTFTFTESEVIGVPENKDGRKIDDDMGRFAIYKIENFRNAFKTPSIRNITLTAPYMHNGVYTSLEEVVDFYNRGGGRGMGLKIENQTLPADSLGLSANEKQALIAFMHALTDTSITADKYKTQRQ
ncbi:MAG: cytochrome C peroxidase [Chitinophagaceae bacterium]|nr:cytochrome C peroxidase [Chitinophagaceae bacterium]